MYLADKPHDSGGLDRQKEPRTGRRAEDETVVERRPLIADAPREDGGNARLGSERRRGERRRVDRMSTGI